MDRHLKPFVAYLTDYKENRFDVMSMIPSTSSIRASEVGQHVERGICEKIAETAFICSTIKTYEDRDTLSTVFSARGYCFSEEKLLQLLSDVFDAGYKSGEHQKVPFSRSGS